MSFSLPNFLRRTPPASLQEYFAHQRFAGFDGIDWQAKPQVRLDGLTKAIEGLAVDARARVFEDFEQVSQLCGETGQLALRLAIPDATLLEDIEARASDEARGLTVHLADRELIKHALAIGYAERQYGGRSWSSHRLPASPHQSDNPIARDRLAADLRAIFKDYDGSGRRIIVDTFERRGRRGECRIVQYTLYIEGLPETRLEFDPDNREEHPQPRLSRPAIEAAICHDPVKGLLDIVAKGGKTVREEIARSFARNLLAGEGGIEIVHPRDWDLDPLKGRLAFSTDTADGIKSVHVVLLRLGDMDGRFGRVTLELYTDRAERADIYAVSRTWFGASDPLQAWEWRVIHATLRIVFESGATGGREKAITIELRRPNGSNLRNLAHRHQAMVEKYLERWGLIAQQ